MATIDTSKSAIDNLLALVNTANTGQVLTNTEVTAAAPVEASGTAGRNTTVVLSGTEGQGFTGTVTVSYTRRPLNDSVADPVFTFAGTIGATAESILAALATQLGLVASEISLQAPGAPGVALTGPINDSPATLTLASGAGSLLYVDASTQAITFTWEAPQVPLDTAVAVTDLDGFDAAS